MNKIGIFGLGKSGVSAAKYFSKEKYKIWADDDNKSSVEKLKETLPEITYESFDSWKYDKLDYIICAPGIASLGVNKHKIFDLVEGKCEIICDIEAFYRLRKGNSSFVGITGTNGKSTTTALTYHIMKEAGFNAFIGGNFGIPVFDLPIEGDATYVLEVSCFQLDLLKECSFDVSCLLNITPDHIDRYESFDNYVLSKKQIFNNGKENSVAIICVDQDTTRKVADGIGGLYPGRIITYQSDDSIFERNFDNLPGKHNMQNILAAYNICKTLGVKNNLIEKSARSFDGLEHRSEKVFEDEKLLIVNDSKATNEDATRPALRTFKNILWLAGGVAKESGINSLSEYFNKINKAYFYGEAAADFAAFYQSEGHENFEIHDGMKQAAIGALEDAANYDGKVTILLSPACASFDEFSNFEERGKAFKKIIMEELCG
jgi:UDP-N-acetylmuramoylalanine--D-glutamate ligase